MGVKKNNPAVKDSSTCTVVWRYSEWDNSSAPSDVFLCLYSFHLNRDEAGHKFQGLEFKNAEQMGTGKFAVAPCKILNWADGRCLRASFYIYFILGGMNSASNTHFLLINSSLASLCQFEILQANMINMHFSKDQVIVFFFSINLPKGCHLRVCVIALKDTAIQSSLKCLPSDLRTRTNSRGQMLTPEEKPENLKWPAQLRIFDLTSHSPPTHQQVSEVCEGPILCSYSNIQMDNQKKTTTPPTPHHPHSHHYPWLCTTATLVFLIGLWWDVVYGRTDETCSRQAHMSIMASLLSGNSCSCRCSAGLLALLAVIPLAFKGVFTRTFLQHRLHFFWQVFAYVNTENDNEWKEKSWWA